MKKRLWLVSREVLATTAEKAAQCQGSVYRIELAADANQPESKGKKTGFKRK